MIAARPLYERLQDHIDRRFDRRRHDALQVLRSRLASPAQEPDLTEVFVDALGDPTATLAYWIDDERLWMTADGRSATRPASMLSCAPHKSQADSTADTCG